MKRLYSLAFKLALLLVVLGHHALAGTGTTDSVDCPVCQTSTKVTLLMSSNNAGGSDRDFMTRCGGAYPLIVLPVTCPKCYYTAYSEEQFRESPPLELKAALLNSPPVVKLPEYEPIVPNSPLRFPFSEGLDSGEFTPSWVRYDLMSQQADYFERPPFERHRIEHMAAWSVRLEENPFQEYLADLTSEDLQNALQALPRKEYNNPADREIETARTLLALESPSRQQAVLAAFLLRTHGELAELEIALPRLEALIGEPSLTETARNSIALERRYLERALAYTDALIVTPPEETDPSIIHYLKGELLRRLGRSAEALSSFQLAAQGTPPQWLQERISQQQSLVEP